MTVWSMKHALPFHEERKDNHHYFDVCSCFLVETHELACLRTQMDEASCEQMAYWDCPHSKRSFPIKDRKSHIAAFLRCYQLFSSCKMSVSRVCCVTWSSSRPRKVRIVSGPSTSPLLLGYQRFCRSYMKKHLRKSLHRWLFREPSSRLDRGSAIGVHGCCAISTPVLLQTG